MTDERQDGAMRGPNIFKEREKDETSIDDATLVSLAELARQQVELEDRIEELQATLKDATAKHRRLSGEFIPEKMREIGLEAFTLSSGAKIEIQKKVKASIPKDRIAEAHAWLREQGFDIIKNNVIASFVKGEEENAEALLADLETRGFVVERKEAVHPSTLGAFVREQMREGGNIPADLFGIYELTETKIVRKG